MKKQPGNASPRGPGSPRGERDGEEGGAGGSGGNKRGTTVPMRVLIGILVATIVLVVSVVTLVITYSVALTSIRNISEKYAVSLIETARARAETYLDGARLDLEMTQAFFRQSGTPEYPAGFLLPNVDPNHCCWQDPVNAMYTQMTLRNKFAYPSSGIVFEDGSSFNALTVDQDTNEELLLYAANMRGYNSTGSGPYVTQESISVVNLRTMVQRRVPRPQPQPRGDARFEAYYIGKQFFPGPGQYWLSLSVFNPDRSKPPLFLFPANINLYSNSGAFIGISNVNIGTGVFSGFLREVQKDPSIEAFATDGARRLVASTHRDNFIETRVTTSRITPSGCASTAAVAEEYETQFTVACFALADNYGYQPLAELAKSDAKFFLPNGSNVKLFKASGNTFYGVSTNVRSAGAQLQLNLILIMPEGLVTGDLVTGRNTAIGATVAIFVLGSLIAFVMVLLLLRPLQRVSKNMHDTARLREKDYGEAEFSSLTEVRDLQKSYYNMNAAIQSFTRYVPRDVVTDLMSSGQLCEIKMAEMYCSMLFTDIQGFTTVCERVPVDQLSILVSQYFDVMSTIVMDHDGLIDKYIGDCIMAVWGAPFPLANHEFKCTLAGLLLNRETLVDPICGAFDEAGEVLGIRVGVNSGVVLAGNMGSSQRMNYTVIGDPVNLAARLESMNKQFGTRVMISEDTAAPLGGIFCIRLLMSIAVVGKAQPVKVYDVVGVSRNVPDKDRQALRENDSSVEVKVQSISDGFSQTSNDSYASQFGVNGRRRHDSNTLLTDAITRTHNEAPLLATEVDSQFAQLFTEAVLLYLREKFKDALDALKRLELTIPDFVIGDRSKVAEYSNISSLQPSDNDNNDDEGAAAPPSNKGPAPPPPARRDNSYKERLRRNVNGERSCEILQTLCEEAIADPSKFTGYFTATEK